MTNARTAGVHHDGAPPLVSIGIPTVSRLHFLKESVECALAQTWPNIEVLVGDNGTTEEIPAWCAERAARDSRLRYHRNSRNLGLPGNWNAIADRAAGEFIVLLADDDRIAPQFVEKLMAAMTPRSAVSFCNQYVITEHGQVLADESEALTRRYHRADLAAGTVPNSAVCAWQMAVCICAAVMRREHVTRLRFADGLTSPDIGFYIRLASEGHPFEFVPEYLADYRLHTASLTAAGLRNDRLALQLIDIPASPNVEPHKARLLAHLLVNAVSQSLRHGDREQARRLLASSYYPRSASRLRYLVQAALTAVPGPVGISLYRAALIAKHAAGR